jgi:hypothetical protein
MRSLSPVTFVSINLMGIVILVDLSGHYLNLVDKESNIYRLLDQLYSDPKPNDEGPMLRRQAPDARKLHN